MQNCVPHTSRGTWQGRQELELRELLDVERVLFKVHRLLQEQVVISLGEHTSLVIIKKHISPRSRSQSSEEPLGWGLSWRYLGEKGKQPIPILSSPSPVPPSATPWALSGKEMRAEIITQQLLSVSWRPGRFPHSDSARAGRCSVDVCWLTNTDLFCQWCLNARGFCSF